MNQILLSVKQHQKQVVRSLIVLLVLSIPFTWVHETGHALGCWAIGHNLLGFDFASTRCDINSLQEGTWYYAMGGAFASIMALLPLTFRRVRTSKAIAIVLLTLATYQLYNAFIETAFHLAYIQLNHSGLGFGMLNAAVELGIYAYLLYTFILKQKNELTSALPSKEGFVKFAKEKYAIAVSDSKEEPVKAKAKRKGKEKNTLAIKFALSMIPVIMVGVGALWLGFSMHQDLLVIQGVTISVIGILGIYLAPLLQRNKKGKKRKTFLQTLQERVIEGEPLIKIRPIWHTQSIDEAFNGLTSWPVSSGMHAVTKKEAPKKITVKVSIQYQADNTEGNTSKPKPKENGIYDGLVSW